MPCAEVRIFAWGIFYLEKIFREMGECLDFLA